MNVEPLSTTSGILPAGADAVRPRGRTPAQDRPAAEPPASRSEAQEDARRAVAEANRQLAQKASELTFEFDDSLSRVIVRLIDKQTGQVLRQIPSKEALQIARALQDESSAGALLRTDA